MLPALSSTPFPKRKKDTEAGKAEEPKEAKKCRTNIGFHELEVQVHDGVGLRHARFSTNDSQNVLREKVAISMGRDPVNVDIGYEAPWSQKVGTKKVPVYITSEMELDFFWSAYDGHREKLEKKGIEGPIAGITFINMKTETQVSACAVLFVMRLNQVQAAASKQTGQSNGRGNVKPTKTDIINEPRNAAKSSVLSSTELVQEGMRCLECNRTCYKKWNGGCGTYTHEHIVEHAKMLVSFFLFVFDSF